MRALISLQAPRVLSIGQSFLKSSRRGFAGSLGGFSCQEGADTTRATAFRLVHAGLSSPFYHSTEARLFFFFLNLGRLGASVS